MKKMTAWGAILVVLLCSLPASAQAARRGQPVLPRRPGTVTWEIQVGRTGAATGIFHVTKPLQVFWVAGYGRGEPERFTLTLLDGKGHVLAVVADTTKQAWGQVEVRIGCSAGCRMVARDDGMLYSLRVGY